MRPGIALTVLSAIFACGPRTAAPDLLANHHAALGHAVVINEILANEPGASTAGEFVELLNTRPEPVDLSGWTLSDGARVRHVFDVDTVLPPHGAYVVYAGASATGEGRSYAAGSSTGALGLGNGGDTVSVRTAFGETIDSVTYPRALGSRDGVSMNRQQDGDPLSDFVLHTSLGQATSSPGTRIDGTPFVRDATETVPLRIVAGNLTSGTRQSYTPGEGARIFQALRPDVALIQEFNFGANSEGELRSFVDQTFGTDFAYVREPGMQLPNGIVSRWPVVESGIWDDPGTSGATRDFIWARIDVPGPRDLWAVSVHLLTSSEEVRDLEAQHLVGRIQAQIPTGDLLVVGGDLNTAVREEPCIATLSQVVVTSGTQPVDLEGNGNTNATRSKPYDWVLGDGDLEALQTGTELGGHAFPAGLVFDSRTFSPLSEVAPVLPTDSASLNMQHMAVVKDYLLPLQP